MAGKPAAISCSSTSPCIYRLLNCTLRICNCAYKDQDLTLTLY